MNNIEEITGILEFLKRNNIENVGFTPIDNTNISVPKEFYPKAILKEAQSIICYALPIPKGVLYADSHDELLFWRFSSIMYRNLDNISNLLSIFLENQGFISTPINSCFPWKMHNREFWGLLPLIYWAEQAGLGKITKCGLLGNPKFGTRILLGGVITSKPFKKSETIHQQICPEDCFKCIEICPVKAIDSTGKVNHDLCMRKANKNPLLTLLMKDTELRESIDFETIINTVGVEDNASYVCMECLKVCPLNQS
jgi:epoxyqueuosine reductase QueG